MILRIHELLKTFGGLAAVDRVSLEVKRADIHAIIGPNGAGKTTLFNLVTRYIQPDGGSIEFKGEDITGLGPDKIVRKGISRSFQTAQIYPTFTVRDNIRMALLARERKTFNAWKAAVSMFSEETDEIMGEIGLLDNAHRAGGSLSQGDKKKLELAVALAGRPALLLLDEPTAGMSLEETCATTELIRHLCEKGSLTVLFTEHDMSVVFNMANRITVLHQGKVLADGTPREVRDDERVQRVYLGMEVG